MQFSSFSHTHRPLLKTNASPIVLGASERSLTGRRWGALHIPTSTVRFALRLHGKAKLASTCNPRLLDADLYPTLSCPRTGSPQRTPPFGNIPHSCPLISKKAIASRGTLQQLNSNTDPRRNGHEDWGRGEEGGRLRKHNETQEFLSITPANPAVQRGAFQKQKTRNKKKNNKTTTPRESKNKTYQVPSISSLPLPP